MTTIKLTENQKIAYERWLNKNVYMLEETKDVLHDIEFHHTATITEEQAEILRKSCPLGFILKALEKYNENDIFYSFELSNGDVISIRNIRLGDIEFARDKNGMAFSQKLAQCAVFVNKSKITKKYLNNIKLKDSLMILDIIETMLSK